MNPQVNSFLLSLVLIGLYFQLYRLSLNIIYQDFGGVAYQIKVDILNNILLSKISETPSSVILEALYSYEGWITSPYHLSSIIHSI